jgi:hypothetical protein
MEYVRSQLPDVSTFEVIIIRCPSVIVNAVLILQLIVWVNYLSWDVDLAAVRAKSVFYGWSGFYFFSPTIIFGFYCYYKVTQVDSRTMQELEAQDRPALPGRPRLQPLAGHPYTAGEHAREAAMEKSILNKFVVFSITTWPIAIKMTLDDEKRYSWWSAFSLMIAFFAYFMYIGYSYGNWLWGEQRSVNVIEAAAAALQAEEEQRLAEEGLAHGDEDEVVLHPLPVEPRGPGGAPIIHLHDAVIYGNPVHAN